MIGGGLVILCGMLEVWPTKVAAEHSPPPKPVPPHG